VISILAIYYTQLQTKAVNMVSAFIMEIFHGVAHKSNTMSSKFLHPSVDKEAEGFDYKSKPDIRSKSAVPSRNNSQHISSTFLSNICILLS